MTKDAPLRDGRHVPLHDVQVRATDCRSGYSNNSIRGVFDARLGFVGPSLAPGSVIDQRFHGAYIGLFLGVPHDAG